MTVSGKTTLGGDSVRDIAAWLHTELQLEQPDATPVDRILIAATLLGSLIGEDANTLLTARTNVVMASNTVARAAELAIAQRVIRSGCLDQD